jgi:hypothetical protein
VNDSPTEGLPQAVDPEKIIEGLASLSPPPEVQEQLALRDATTLVLTSEDLGALPDDTLLEADSAHISRVTYVVGLSRLSKYLRKTVPLDMEEGQARLALAYIRHAEDKLLTAMQMGRAAKDDKFAREVAVMREDIRRMSEIRAKNTVKERMKKKEEAR